MRIRLVSALVMAGLAARALSAQAAAPWPSIHQTNGWYGSIYEQALSPTLAVVTDIQLRRSGLVEHPKQLFMVGGLSWRATPGVRLTLGGGYIASTPYGLLPAASPAREYQLWYQLALQQHAGPLDFSHRYRFENRWIHDVLRDDAGTHDSDSRFAHRLRYQLRVSHAFEQFKIGRKPLLGFAADEAFLGLTASERRVSFDQNRTSVGIGVPLAFGERVEVGYLQQWIANSRLKTSEVNRTLLIMFVHNVPR